MGSTWGHTSHQDDGGERIFHLQFTNEEKAPRQAVTCQESNSGLSTLMAWLPRVIESSAPDRLPSSSPAWRPTSDIWDGLSLFVGLSWALSRIFVQKHPWAPPSRVEEHPQLLKNNNVSRLGPWLLESRGWKSVLPSPTVRTTSLDSNLPLILGFISAGSFWGRT